MRMPSYSLLQNNLDPHNAAMLDLHCTSALEGCLILEKREKYVRALKEKVCYSPGILATRF